MTKADTSRLARRIAQALGEEPADLVLRDARIVNMATGTVEAGDIAVCDDVIVGIGERRAGRIELDARGRFAIPGLIDTHLHVESSLLTPEWFDALVLPRGTTTAICDPHEIANVLGLVGIRYFLDAATRLRLTLLVNLSSCVPASPFETAGARLEAADLAPLLDHPNVLGLAEVMNFPGVVARDEGLLAKLVLAAGRHVDGHAPLLTGRSLDAYLAAGIRTDHECSRLEEAREKLAKGMAVLMREGSIAKNVATLAPLIGEATWSRLAFCTDDRNPLEIETEGHLDHALRVAIAAGAPTLPTYRAATLGAATIFGLRDRGLLAPGYRADIVLLDDLETVAVSEVVCGGRMVATLPPLPSEGSQFARGTVRRGPVAAAELMVPSSAGAKTPVIVALPFSLITERDVVALPEGQGEREADSAAGIMRLVVAERHGRGGGIGRGFVRGFGSLRGALAGSVGHDSHNLIAAGTSKSALAFALNRVIELGGGFVVVDEKSVLAELPLPIAGLMSDREPAFVNERLRELHAAARTIGCVLDEPFLQLAFLPLSVIPHLKLTDQGLVAHEDGQLRRLAL